MKTTFQRFRNQKIYKKIFQTNAISVTVAVTPLIFSLFTYEYFSMRSIALNEVKIKTDIVSDSAAAAMAFRDKATATEALATLEASPEIDFAYLVLPTSEILASYSNGSNIYFGKNKLDKRSIKELDKSKYTITKPLYLKSNFVGVIVVRASLSLFYKQIFFQFIFILIASSISLALSLYLSKYFRKEITDPLDSLVDFVNNFNEEQDYQIRPPNFSKDEIGELSLAFNKMMEHLQERDERLKNLAFYDGITGLPNRNYFKERILQTVANCVENNILASVFFIDLDDFKKVNDTLGHEAGDQLLKVIAQRFRSTLASKDSVFRIGGDEFAVIIEDINDTDELSAIARKIIETVSKDVILGKNTTRVGASIGISICPQHATEVSTLLMLADSAMYTAKAKSKNTFHLYKGETK